MSRPVSWSDSVGTSAPAESFSENTIRLRCPRPTGPRAARRTGSRPRRSPTATSCSRIVPPPCAVRSIRASSPAAVIVRSSKPAMPLIADRSGLPRGEAVSLSSPAPPYSVSSPTFPYSVSAPSPPCISSAPSPPHIRSAPSPPWRGASPAPPNRESAPRRRRHHRRGRSSSAISSRPHRQPPCLQTPSDRSLRQLMEGEISLADSWQHYSPS